MEHKMDKQEALELLLKAKELGVRSIKVHGLEAEFFTPTSSTSNILSLGNHVTYSDTAHIHEKRSVPDMKAEELVKPTIVLDDLTEEQILFAASEGLPEEKE